MERDRVLKEKLVLKKSIRRLINQTLISIIILLVGLIVIRKDVSLKEKINKKIYEDNIEFIKVKNLYDKYFGELLPISNLVSKEQPVFNEKIKYLKEEKYLEGVKLTVDNNIMIPSMKDGIVVFIGEKENYGNTIVVEQTDGVDVTYGNIDNINVKLYDYVESGTLLGQAKDNYMYLVFQKEGNNLDYKQYI
ncbi:MAG: M23 family metallopeptidase [Bacilli bacterium]|nr:M23 family metallopeptidase [Bacilli bacterium]